MWEYETLRNEGSIIYLLQIVQQRLVSTLTDLIRVSQIKTLKEAISDIFMAQNPWAAHPV